MGDDLERFVASLAIPADRKTIVLAELADHIASATEAARRAGMDPEAAEAAGRAAIGDLETLRTSLETVEPAFRVSRAHAAGRGVVAAIAVVIAYEGVGWLADGWLAALVALAGVALIAPPRPLELLRAELGARRIRGRFGVRSVPIGPMVIYAYLVMGLPVVYGVAMMTVHARQGLPLADVPLSNFAVMIAAYAVLLVEAIRVRRRGAVA